MDVSKRLNECIKRMHAFHTLMDKPTRTFVSDHCQGGNERLTPEF